MNGVHACLRKTDAPYATMSATHGVMPAWTPPSLSSVRAFEAAARLSSFTKAGAELNITQSAISYSVRELEQRLGLRLFTRDGPRLGLTEAGRTYLPFAAEALERLRAGDRALTDPARKDRVLTVSVSPSFAAKWLVPRLGDFIAVHPDIDLRISANPAHVDFADGEIDLAVRHGRGDWPGLSCTRLCEETMFPVCSPALLQGAAPRSPADLGAHVLIHHRTPDEWRDWLAAFGVDGGPQVAHGPVLNEMSLTIDAAIAGQGVALARSALASRDLGDGRLVRPMRHETPADFAYWIVCSHATARRPNVIRCTAWLLEQASAA